MEVLLRNTEQTVSLPTSKTQNVNTNNPGVLSCQQQTVAHGHLGEIYEKAVLTSRKMQCGYRATQTGHYEQQPAKTATAKTAKNHILMAGSHSICQPDQSPQTSTRHFYLYIFLCEKRNCPFSPFCAPHHVVPDSRVVHVTRAEPGGVLSSIPPIDAPLPVHFDAVVCLQQSLQVLTALYNSDCISYTAFIVSLGRALPGMQASHASYVPSLRTYDHSSYLQAS